jgi:hypothetical protein
MKKNEFTVKGVRKMRIKVNKPKPAAPLAQSETEAAPISEKPTVANDTVIEQTVKTNADKHKSALSLRLAEFNRLSAYCKNELGLNFVSVYRIDDGEITHVAGDRLSCHITVERYFSYTATTILTAPHGFFDNPGCKSRLITLFKAHDVKYLVCFGSFALEGFSANAAKIINGVTVCRNEIVCIDTGGSA